MAEYQVHEHDVLVIGAGGAGLRAAIEASAAGVSVGLVCKSLLGKAHTVMAEGGIAAALANVDDRDSWKVHFADTMRGGQYVNNWRMAQLHAQEAPDRVRELEAWGAVFDRTKDGRILQRNFGGHRYPRLAHVGDRTGLEMIRTLQDHGIHQGIEVYMECTIIRLLKDGDRIAGAFGYYRERGRFVLFKAKAVVLATGGIGKAYKITSNSWEYTGDGHALGLRRRRRTDRHGVHPVPSDRDGLAAERPGHPGDRGRARRGRRACATTRASASCSTTSRRTTRRRRPTTTEEGWLLRARARSSRATRSRPPELLTRDHVARCIVREVKEGRGSPHGGVFLDWTFPWIKSQGRFNAAEHIKKKLPSMYHQFKELGDIDITKRADGGRPDDALHHGRRARRCRHADVADDSGPVRLRRMCGGHQRGQPPGRQLAVRPAGVRQACRRIRGQVREGARRRQRSTASRSRRRRAGRCRSWIAPQGDENPYKIQQDLQEMMQELVGIVRTEDEMLRALEGLAKLWERARQVARAGNREYNPGWHTSHGPAQPADGVGGGHARAPSPARRAEAASSATTTPQGHGQLRQGELVVWRGEDGRMQIRLDTIPEMPAELKQIIRETERWQAA